MSFRSGPNVVLLTRPYNNSDVDIDVDVDVDVVFNTKQNNVIKMSRPLLFDLIVSLSAIGVTQKCNLFVKRDGRKFSINSDRDVEELGGSTGEEILYYEYYGNDNTHNMENLANYALTSDQLNYTKYINSNNIDSKSNLQQLQTNGYFKVQLTKSERTVIDNVFKLMIQFTSELQTEKEKYAFSSIGHMQPQFGYRSTNLQKEIFVCRKLSHSIGVHYPSDVFNSIITEAIDMLGNIAQNILRDILLNLNANSDEIECLLKKSLAPVEDINLLGKI